eukprot:scaffold114336_cov76-Cyclotella_meneghiniana.AAC.12
MWEKSLRTLAGIAKRFPPMAYGSDISLPAIEWAANTSRQLFWVKHRRDARAFNAGGQAGWFGNL